MKRLATRSRLLQCARRSESLPCFDGHTGGMGRRASPGGASSAPAAASAGKSAPDHPGFYAGEAILNPSERAGREIWYKATAGNARFHTYVFQQRVNVLIDWYRVLNANERGDRFAAWGIINDPGCCVPGSKDCPATTLEQTYGFEWCPGDDELLKFVGRAGYRDPACDFKEAPIDPADPHNKAKDQRQSSCDLAFGTSTGALGLPQVSESALRPGALAQGQRQPRKLGRLSRRTVEGSEVERFGAEPPGRRFDRAAVFDRHHLRLVPHLVRSAESSEGSGQSGVGKPERRSRQPVLARVGDPDLRHVGRDARSADVRACAAWNVGHFGHRDRSGAQPRHDERDHQYQGAADLRGRKCHPLAQGGELLAAGRQLLVRARPRQQVLAARRCDRDRASHPQRRRRLDRRARGDPARVLQHRLVLRAVLGQPSDRSAPARSDQAQFRTNAVRHRSMPARLPELPCDRRSTARHPCVPDVEGNRCDRPRRCSSACEAGGESQSHIHQRGSATRSRQAVRRQRRGAWTRSVRDDVRALPFVDRRDAGEHVQESRLQRRRRRWHARRLDGLRPGDAGDRSRYQSLPRACTRTI